jgi:hypothetical protein
MTVLRPGEHPDELISASLTGDLSVAEQEALDGHLADCARCSETLAAFKEERRLISGMRHAAPPRDLGARVRTGIERGRSGSQPWWRQTPLLVAATASLAAVAAGVLGFVVLTNVRPPEVAQGTPSASASSDISSSVEPTAEISATPEPTPTATVNPQAFLRPGELGYFSMTGGSQEAPKLTFVKNANGQAVEAMEAPSGPPIGAALSPDAEWIAYITEIAESGANQVWALHLTDGETIRLGCAAAGPFADRLLWSDESELLAYTLTAIDLGSTYDCGAGDPDRAGSTDVWVFRTDTREVTRITDSGDAFAADIGHQLEGATPILVSHAAETPWTDYVWVKGTSGIGPDVDESIRIDGVFLPLLSPFGEQAIYWTGSMSRSEQDGVWQFTTGGLPEVGQLNPAGESERMPLFADLSGRGGDGFQDGHFGWGADGDLVAFWGGLWTGSPQGEDYPSELAAYAGRLTEGGLSRDSRIDIPLDAESARIISVAVQPDGVSVVVSVGDASRGIGDPGSANLYRVPIGGGDATKLGGATDSAPWDGPAVFGPDPQGPF